MQCAKFGADLYTLNTYLIFASEINSLESQQANRQTLNIVNALRNET